MRIGNRSEPIRKMFDHYRRTDEKSPPNNEIYLKLFGNTKELSQNNPRHLELGISPDVGSAFGAIRLDYELAYLANGTADVVGDFNDINRTETGTIDVTSGLGAYYIPITSPGPFFLTLRYNGLVKVDVWPLDWRLLADNVFWAGISNNNK